MYTTELLITLLVFNASVPGLASILSAHTHLSINFKEILLHVHENF